MRYLSVCSGIEAATVAWHGLGWEPAAFSEIEKFPSDVLKHHYPNVPNLGDMTKFKEWNLGAIDLLVGGTPCQSFSVAGLRKGLDDPRGNLMLTFGAIARHLSPRWLVWENVPGVLSSNGGRDFGTFLGMLGELGYGFAYRVLDAQYFGVAQRRRRVFVVGCLGGWRLAAAVLFELASLSGNPAPSREKGQRPSPGPQSGPAYGGSNPECADTVTSKWAKGSGGPSGNEGGLFVAQPVGVPEVMSTLLSSTAGVSRPGNEATEHETYIPMVQPVPYDLYQVTAPVNRQNRKPGDPCHTLARDNAQHAAVVHPISIHPHCIGRSAEAGPQGKEYLEDGTAYCMDSRGQPQAVVQPIPLDLRNSNRDPEKHDEVNRQGIGVGDEGDAAYTITSARVHGVAAGLAVRRLTPVECERLQGFPDNYTNIRTNCPDGPRYKALGNSMAVPVMAWIGRRINELQKQETS